MSRCGLWFGTEEYMQWVETPLSGADVSPQGWNTGGTLLSGGGFSARSRGTHRVYNYAWRNSSDRGAAQVMKNYYSGTWGTGLIYFLDPLTYSTNLFPDRWAAPGNTLEFEGPSLVYGVTPEPVEMTGWKTNGYPMHAAQFDLSNVPVGYREGESVFIPIPDGFTMYLGGSYETVGTGGVFYSIVDGSGSVDSVPNPVDVVDISATTVLGVTPIIGSSEVAGIRVWFGRTSDVESYVTVHALIARIVESTAPTMLVNKLAQGPWFGGQGHSGCDFAGTPTYVEYNGVGGGQVGYAVTFKEVGSWV